MATLVPVAKTPPSSGGEWITISAAEIGDFPTMRGCRFCRGRTDAPDTGFGMNPAPPIFRRDVFHDFSLPRQPAQKRAATFLVNPAGLPEPLARMGSACVDGSDGHADTLSRQIHCNHHRRGRGAHDPHQCPQAPGNSGGGLFDHFGNLIGIIRLRKGDKANFAVPVEDWWEKTKKWTPARRKEEELNRPAAHVAFSVLHGMIFVL